MVRLYGVAIWFLFTIYINMYNQVYKSSTVKKKITMWNRLGVDMIGEINNNFFFRSFSSFSTKRYQSFLIRSELYLSPITAWFPGFSSLYDDYCTVSFESVWFIHHVQIGHLLCLFTIWPKGLKIFFVLPWCHM